MLAANFLDYLPQPNDTRYFQAVAPFSNRLAHGGRLFSLPKLHFIGNLRAPRFLFDALFDNGDLFAREAVKGIDMLVDFRLSVSQLGTLAVYDRGPNRTRLNFLTHKNSHSLRSPPRAPSGT